ncbi:RNA-binding domain-containing protein [Suillus decipiens]|nr:RNA-binding domain-containing protein [Suillus decipiens]
MFSKALLAQSRTFSASLRARATLSSLALLPHASPGKVSTALQWHRALSTSLALHDDEPRFGDRNSRQRGFRRNVPPSGTLYIGNLPFSITEEELRQSFAEFGEVVRVSLGTTPEGASRGFGHVQFASVDDAIKVMKADEEDPIYIMNRDIYLDHAAVQEDASREPYHTLFVRPFGGAEDDLRVIFSNFEHSIADVRLLRDRMTGESKGSGFVEFKNAEVATEALEAIKDQKDPLTGRPVVIKYAKPTRLNPASDIKSNWDGKKRGFNQREKGPRHKNSYGGDWQGSQRTGDYRDS